MSPAPHTTAPEVLRDGPEMQRRVHNEILAGRRVGLVPTMGALHEGHLSLVKRALDECDATAVSVFVNPTQFGPGEDFECYPRRLEDDVRILADLGVRWVFAPGQSDVYPTGFSTFVDPPAVASPLEGACRPGHFRGVVTVVLKLFHMVPASVAYFGEKDYQQWLVIRDMVRDLAVPIELRLGSTVREADGLALSSRNQYLDPSQRARAVAISEALREAQALVRRGERRADRLRDQVLDILETAGITDIDYVAVADAQSLTPLTQVDRPARCLVAVRVGSTRLIDNCALVTARDSI